jgi:hypothetical protein
MATPIKSYEMEDFNERVMYHLAIQEMLSSNAKVLDLNDFLEQCLPVRAKTSASLNYFKAQYPTVVLLNRFVESLREDPRSKFNWSRVAVVIAKTERLFCINWLGERVVRSLMEREI